MVLIIRCNLLHLAVIVRSLYQKTFAKGNFTWAHLPNQIANTIIGNGFAVSISSRFIYRRFRETKVIPLTENS
ncbi:hypothetical protein [Nostoc sp.]